MSQASRIHLRDEYSPDGWITPSIDVDEYANTISPMNVVGYEITAGAYYGRGLRNLDIFRTQELADHLFYAGLEYRNAIERVVFELLYLRNVDNWQEKWEKEYRVTRLKDLILSIDPEFEKLLEFLALYLTAVGFPSNEPINLSYLSELYGRVGNFLHAQKRPDTTAEDQAWWEKFYSLLQEVDIELNRILSSPMGAMSLSEKGLDLFYRWLAGTTSDEHVITEIRHELGSR